MPMKRLLIALIGSGLLSVFAVGTPANSRNQVSACAGTRAIGLLAPISGDVAFLGREQRNWARLAVLRYNGRRAKRARLVEADTALQPARAAVQAQQLAANSRVLAVVGPAGSDEVSAVAPAFRRARMPYVSGSATRASLTSGANAGFFRVVANANLQAPAVVGFLISRLRVRDALVVDDQTSYSTPLADAVEHQLEARDVSVERESVKPGQTNYSAVIAKIDRNTGAVVLPWQNPARAQLFGQQMETRGKRVPIFGTDGLFSSEFRIKGSYVSMFAPDYRRIAAARAIVRDYDRRYGRNWSVFGAPTYVAAQVALGAVQRACRDGKATRAEVRTQLARTRLRTSALGTPISFTRLGELVRARFFVYRIVGAKFVLVR
jgi:branched-chain amino acid transport system substrate-binding protein